MRPLNRFTCVCALLLGAPGSEAHPQQLAPRDFRGTNYLPATTRALDNVTALLPHNNPSGLTGAFSPTQVEDEVRLLASYGINNVRILPAFYAFVVDKAAYMRSLRELARICARHGVRITYICWNAVPLSTAPFPGGPAELWEELAGSAAIDATNPTLHASLLARSREMGRLYGHLVPPGRPHFYGVHAEPGNDLLSTFGGDCATWPYELKTRIDEYLDAVAAFFALDPDGRAAFASYDLFNEANILGPGLETEYLRFIDATCRRIRAIHPDAHLTVGWASASEFVDRMHKLLATRWRVHLSYLSGHSYSRPELFEERVEARKRYAASHGLDFVMSEFHRVDYTAGVLEYALSALVRHGVGGQMWGVIQSNAWIDHHGSPGPIDGVVAPIDPGSPTGPIRFSLVNSRDSDALRRWGFGQLVPREFTHIEMRDGAGKIATALSAGALHELRVRSTLTGAPVLLAFGLERFPLAPCDRIASTHCTRIRSLGSVFFSPGMVALYVGTIDPRGYLQPPLQLPLPAVAGGFTLGATALVGSYPHLSPESNPAELTALHAWHVR